MKRDRHAVLQAVFAEPDSPNLVLGLPVASRLERWQIRVDVAIPLRRSPECRSRLVPALRRKVTDLVDVFNKHVLATLVPPRE